MNIANTLSICTLALVCLFSQTAESQSLSSLGKLIGGKVIKEAGKQVGKTALKKSATELAETAAKQSLKNAVSRSVIKSTATKAGKLAVKYGDDASRALVKLGPQANRRLLMMSDDIAASGQGAGLMKLIAERGDAEKIIAFLWKHRLEISAGTMLASFVINPDTFLNAAENVTTKLADTAAEHVVEPVIEQAVTPLIHWLGCIAVGVGIIAGGWLVLTHKPKSTGDSPNEATT